MESVENSVVIRAPVEKVFAYLDDPTHEPDFWPSLVEIRDVESLPEGGHRNRWTYKMAGIRLEGTGEDIERVENKRLVTKTTGGTDSVQTWTLEPQGPDTKVTFRVEYTVPIPVLGKLAEAVIVKLNKHEGDVILENLKAILESA